MSLICRETPLCLAFNFPALTAITHAPLEVVTIEIGTYCNSKPCIHIMYLFQLRVNILKIQRVRVTSNPGHVRQYINSQISGPISIAKISTITQLPVSLTLTQIIQYRDIRLEALCTNPSCFSSSYARELSFNEEQWGARSNSTANEKVTFIATVDDNWVGTVSWDRPC